MFQNFNLSVVEMDHMDALGESAEDYSSLDDLSDTQDEGKYELDVEPSTLEMEFSIKCKFSFAESDEDWEKDVKAMMRRIR